MLVIKKDQIEHFIAEDNTRLIRVITEIIREAFFESVEDYSDETLESMVKIGINRAKSHGFERAEHIASFVAIMFEISPNFDMIGSIQSVLTDKSIPDEGKFEQLLGLTTEEDWQEAEKSYDSTVWFPENGDGKK